MLRKDHQLVASTDGLFADVIDLDGEIVASIPLQRGVNSARKFLPFLVEGTTLRLPKGVQHLVPPTMQRTLRHPNHVDTGAQHYVPRQISDIERRMNERLRATEAMMSRMMAEVKARGGDTAPMQDAAPAPAPVATEAVGESTPPAEANPEAKDD